LGNEFFGGYFEVARQTKDFIWSESYSLVVTTLLTAITGITEAAFAREVVRKIFLHFSNHPAKPT
jgi:hypothetical protein